MTTPRRGGSLAASYDTLGASFAAVTARKRFTDANETAGDETACRRRRDWRQGTRGKTRWDRIRGLIVPGEQERREEARCTFCELRSNAPDGRHNETGCADVRIRYSPATQITTGAVERTRAPRSHGKTGSGWDMAIDETPPTVPTPRHIPHVTNRPRRKPDFSTLPDPVH